MAAEDFALIEQQAAPNVDDFALVESSTPSPEVKPRPVADAVLSVATSEDSPVDTISALQEQNLAKAREIVAQGQEFQARVGVAAKRQERMMRSLNNLRDRPLPGILSNETTRTVDEGYRLLAQERVEQNAKTSAELETVRRIQDHLTTDPVEAKLTWNLFNHGTAMEVFEKNAVKNLLLAQAAERYRAEAGDETWGGTIYNFITSVLPTNYNFSRSGIVKDSGAGVLDFFLSGENVRKQGDALLSRYDDPKDLAAALAPGGELDVAIRSNATTLGGFDPTTAAALTGELAYTSEQDRFWSNVWGLADAGTLGAGVALKGVRGAATTLPDILTRMGSRSAARAVIGDALETAAADSAESAARRTGMSADDIARSMEPTAANPGASTEHAVPHGVDVDASLRAAEEVRKTLPEQLQVSRATTPEELQSAYQAAHKAEEKRIGQSIKDWKPMYEDIRTGEKAEFRGAIPEQGNVVHYIEYTVGKKDGGGFASARTAAATARKRGLAGVEFEEVVTEVERRVRNADTGHTTRAFHGTGRAFDDFDLARGGEATGGPNTDGVVFFTADPSVAHSYAVQAAGAFGRERIEQITKIFKGELPMPAGVTEEALEDELINLTEGLLDNAGANIRPVDLNTENFLVTPDMAGRMYNGPESIAIINQARKEGKDGVIFRNYDDDIFNGKPSDIYAVINPEAMKPAFNENIVRDVSGQWFIKSRVNVREEGFMTAPLNTPENNFFSGLRSDARRMDRSAQAKAVSAGLSAGQLQRAINREIKNVLRGLSRAEKRSLDEVIRKGQNESKWYNTREFNVLYERAHGEAPSPKVERAYNAYKLFNDVEYLERNDELYKSLVVRGHESVEFTVAGRMKFNGTAVVDANPRLKPAERIFNVSDGVHYSTENHLSSEQFRRLIDDGYMLVKAREPFTFPDGVVVRNFLVKRGDISRRPLEKMQLGYKAGGHRAYTGKYFAKQATEGVQPDTGQRFLKNPNVFRTGNNPNRLRDWAAAMNRAIDDYNAGILDPSHYDDNVFATLDDLSFPSGEEFLEAVEKGAIDRKNHIEIVGDREMPAAYSTAREDVARFVDEEESATTGYYRTTGRLYDSRRGEHLLDESGEFAETVDPWETMNKAMANISRMTSFSNYKMSTIERFSKTYGPHLALRDLDNTSPQALISAEVKQGTPPSLYRRIRAEQEGIKRILSHETEWERGTRMASREMAEWVLGDARGGWRETAHDFVYWLKRNDPVRFLRALAFDVKLGLFNVSQFLLQSATIAASVSIHPTHGLAGMRSMVPTFAYTMSQGAENVLDVLAKRSWKAAGFESEREFKDFHRFLNRTGFMNVGNTQLMINDFGPNRVFGAAGAIDAVREKGRSLFYGAEQLNRAVASRMAYELLKEQGVEFGTATFRERFIGIADDLTLNMTAESAAAFQHGLLSIPTQFWAYNVRMMDAMFGGNFTKAQRARLITSQFMLAGAGGVPVVDALADYLKRTYPPEIDPETGEIENRIEGLMGLLDRGVIDKALYEVFGADVRFGERVGTGAFLTNTIKDIFGMGEYGEKSPIEALGGATFSISTSIGETIGNVAKYAYAETGGNGNYEITRESLLKMAMNVSSISNTVKGLLAYNYGIYKSNSGNLQATDLPQADAFWVALGLRPQELDELSSIKNYLDNKEDSIKEAANQVRLWRTEAFRSPDKFNENMEKVNTFMALLPADVRQDVLRRTNRITDDSFYDYVTEKYNEEKMKEELLNDGER